MCPKCRSHTLRSRAGGSTLLRECGAKLRVNLEPCTKCGGYTDAFQIREISHQDGAVLKRIGALPHPQHPLRRPSTVEPWTHDMGFAELPQPLGDAILARGLIALTTRARDLAQLKRRPGRISAEPGMGLTEGPV